MSFQCNLCFSYCIFFRWLKVLEKLVVAEIPEDAQIARLSSDSDNSDKSEKSELSEKTDDS